MAGVSTLQGLYDSISGGRCRATGVTKYGHSEDYFKFGGSRRGGIENKAIEALAEYVSLVAVSSPYVEVFRRDKPEIAKQLDETIEAIKKKVS